MYQHHFGLKYSPLGKETPALWDDGTLEQLAQRFQWLLDSPGVGLLTGEAGVGRTAMQLAVPKGLNHLPDELIQQAIEETK